MDATSQTVLTAVASAAVGSLAVLAGMAMSQRSQSSGHSQKDESEILARPPSNQQTIRRRAIEAELNAAADSIHPDWHGFSMEEAREHSNIRAKQAAERTPKQVLLDLQRGNARFWMGAATRPEVSAFERRALIMQQYPAVAILGCSDSRVPIEIVFDQGLGDIFVIRVAGNCLDTTTSASLQYAINHLKVKVVVVMGHEGCGAVKAASLPIEDINKEAKELSNMLKMIKNGLDSKRMSTICDSRARDRECVVANVRQQLGGLIADKSVIQAVKDESLIVVGAFYEISSGIVDFFDDVSKEEDLAKLDLRGRTRSFKS